MLMILSVICNLWPWWYFTYFFKLNQFPYKINTKQKWLIHSNTILTLYILCRLFRFSKGNTKAHKLFLDPELWRLKALEIVAEVYFWSMLELSIEHKRQRLQSAFITMCRNVRNPCRVLGKRLSSVGLGTISYSDISVVPFNGYWELMNGSTLWVDPRLVIGW